MYGSSTPSPMRSAGAARSCCWPARPGSARRAWPRRSRRRAMRWRCAARRVRPRRCPTGRSWAPCAATCGQRRARWPRAARCRGTSRCCCPSSGRRSPRATAPRCSSRCAARWRRSPPARPAVILLDDLQWSDDATLELLGALADPLRELPVLVVGAYRSDEVPRAHPLRGLRNELRRDRALRELALEPLDRRGDGRAGRPGPRRRRRRPRSRARCYDRTQGVPFFVEELAGALESGGRLTDGRAAASSSRATARSRCPRRSATRCSCARPGCRTRRAPPPRRRRWPGARFDLELVAALGGDAGLDGAAHQRARGRDRAGRGLVPSPAGARRHLRGRAVAAAPCAAPAPGRGPRGPRRSRGRGRLALARRARRPAGARRAAARRSTSSRPLHAYRDEARARRGARWSCGPRASARAERIALLERYARSAELAGDLTEAARARREVVAARRAEGVGRALADAERRLAAIYELQRRPRARARRAARGGRFVRRPTACRARRRPSGWSSPATCRAPASTARRSRSRALAGEEAAARRAHRPARPRPGPRGRRDGQGRRARRRRRDGPRRALARAGPRAHAEAAELYQRLGTALETAGDYGGAHEALTTAVGLCRTGGADALEHVCLSCVAYVLRELGDWDASVELCHELQAGDVRPDDTLVADGALGAIHAFRGEPARARPLLLRCARHRRAPGRRLHAARHGRRAGLAGGPDRRPRRGGRALPVRARALGAQRGSSTTPSGACAGRRASSPSTAPAREARACADALARIAAHTGHPDARAALAHALGGDGAARRRRGDRRRADRARAGAPGHARHPVRARADPAARGRRPRRRRRARAGAGTPRRRLSDRAPPRAPARWPCRPPRRPRDSASRSSAGSGAVRPPRTTAPG